MFTTLKLYKVLSEYPKKDTCIQVPAAVTRANSCNQIWDKGGVQEPRF